MRIGIFDSGKGGHIVARQLKQLRPADSFLVVDDTAHVPYGSRSPEQILELTESTIQPLLPDCDVIVLACNTATAVAIDTLRQHYPATPFVGFEPMVKTAAALTNTGTIVILATPATLRSPRYLALKQRWAAGITVLEPDCSDWAGQIEAGTFDTAEAIDLARKSAEAGADVIALACTHYLYLQLSMQEAVNNRSRIVTPVEAVNRQIDRVTAATVQPPR